MSEYPHTKELADKLRETRNEENVDPKISRAKAQGYLEAKKETKEYEISEKMQREESQFYREAVAGKEIAEKEVEAIRNDDVVGHLFQLCKLDTDISSGNVEFRLVLENVDFDSIKFLEENKDKLSHDLPHIDGIICFSESAKTFLRLDKDPKHDIYK